MQCTAVHNLANLLWSCCIVAQLHTCPVAQLHSCTVTLSSLSRIYVCRDVGSCTAPYSIGSWTDFEHCSHSTELDTKLCRATWCRAAWCRATWCRAALRFCVQIPIIVRHQACTAGSASHLHSVLFVALLCRDLQHCSILALGLGWDTWGHEYPILTLHTDLLHSCTEAAKFCQNCIASTQVLHLQYTGAMCIVHCAMCIVLQSSHESQNRAFIWLAPPSNAPVTSTLKAQIGVKIEDCGD